MTTTTNATKLDAIRARIAEAKKKQQQQQPVNNFNRSAVMNNTGFVAPATENQINMYIDLCGRKGQDIAMNYRSMSGVDMSKEIKRLLRLPNIRYASEAQLNMIKDILERNGWEADCDITKLINDGREKKEGSAGAYIEELLTLEREMQSVAPPTLEQLETILEMVHCPDVDFADLHEAYETVYTVVDGKTWWKSVSAEDIIASYEELITYREASDFIRKYQVEFYQWKATRLSIGQMDLIKDRQKRCGMQPMEDYALLQFDKKTAKEYTTRLELVWRDADLVKFQYEKTYEDMSADRPCHDPAEVAKKAITAKENLVHGLYGAIGMLAKEDSQEHLDQMGYDNTDAIVKEVALLAVEQIGYESVMSMLLTVYTTEELDAMFPPQQEKLMTKEEVVAEINNITDILYTTQNEDEYKANAEALRELLDKYKDSIDKKLYEDCMFEVQVALQLA